MKFLSIAETPIAAIEWPDKLPGGPRDVSPYPERFMMKSDASGAVYSEAADQRTKPSKAADPPRPEENHRSEQQGTPAELQEATAARNDGEPATRPDSTTSSVGPKSAAPHLTRTVAVPGSRTPEPRALREAMQGLAAPVPVRASTEESQNAIVQVALRGGVQIFRDQFDAPYATIPAEAGTSGSVCHPISSSKFRAAILALAAAAGIEISSMRTLNSAVDEIRVRSWRKKKYALANRYAQDEGRLLIDLCNDRCEQIVVSSEGWSIEPTRRPTFARYAHQKPLEKPQKGGCIDDLFQFIHMQDQASRLLLVTWMLAACHPAVPNPILMWTGPQGSAKTTDCKRIRKLLDPSEVPNLGDIDVSHLHLLFQHHAVPVFENVSSFSRDTADKFCRAATGAGGERRRLYSDDGQHLFRFRRPIVINGITHPSRRPDFLDRCLHFERHRLASFRAEADIEQEFEAAAPQILGGMFDLLTNVLGELSQTDLTSGPFRMAGFAKFGRAVASCYGMQPQDFDNAYLANIEHRNLELLDDDPLAELIAHIAADHDASSPWRGTATDLWKKLHSRARISRSATLPRAPHVLSRRLAELASALESQRIQVRQLPRTRDSRMWEIFNSSASMDSVIIDQVRSLGVSSHD